MSGPTRRLKVSVPLYAERLIGAARAAAWLVHKLMRDRNISVSDVAFGLFAVMTAGIVGLFVALLLSA